MNLKNIIADYLRASADNILNDTCSMTLEELELLVALLMHLEMNKTEAAELLNMSIRTFDRKVEAGELPKGIKTVGSNLKIWYKDELINIMK